MVPPLAFGEGDPINRTSILWPVDDIVLCATQLVMGVPVISFLILGLTVVVFVMAGVW